MLGYHTLTQVQAFLRTAAWMGQDRSLFYEAVSPCASRSQLSLSTVYFDIFCTLKLNIARARSLTLRANDMLWLSCTQVNFSFSLLFSKTKGGCLLCAAHWECPEILLWMPVPCSESVGWKWGRGYSNMPELELVSLLSLVYLQPLRLCHSCNNCLL